MKYAHGAIEMTTLKRSEQIYRTRLANDPNDSEVRIKLAWCLFMQALYRAGQESMLSALVATSMDEPREKQLHPKCVWDQDAQDLIRDCLCQSSTVIQLSANPRHRTDAQRLQALVRLSGCELAVSQAREKSSRLLSEVLQEIL